MSDHLAEAIEKISAIAVAAEAFVRAHCELEALASKIGPVAACNTELNRKVILLHLQLEALVLGDESVHGRRTSP